MVAAAAVVPFEAMQSFQFKSNGARPVKPTHPDSFLYQIRDSKLIPESNREPLANQVRAYVSASSVQEASVDEIGTLNILYASHLAMERAVMAVEAHLGRRADIVLVDGNIVPQGLKDRGLAIIKGDQKSITIACASILAKVYRDNLMVRLDLEYPGYGHQKHKGYPTPFHKKQILSLGVTPIHRKGFKGVK